MLLRVTEQLLDLAEIHKSRVDNIKLHNEAKRARERLTMICQMMPLILDKMVTLNLMTLLLTGAQLIITMTLKTKMIQLNKIKKLQLSCKREDICLR